MTHPGNAADDPAIWKNKAYPSRSTIIATDKKGGIAVYNLKGALVQYRPGVNGTTWTYATAFP